MTDKERRKIERRYKRWLENGGKEKLETAMQRAKQTSEDFARSTQVDWRTLYEPIGSASDAISVRPAYRPSFSAPIATAYQSYKGAPRS